MKWIVIFTHLMGNPFSYEPNPPEFDTAATRRGGREMSFNQIEAALAAMSEQRAIERSRTQMTLGKMIEDLEKLPPDAEVVNLHDPHSYRGYYRDLAFELGVGTRPASALLEDCRKSLGQFYDGYKGGEFLMHVRTPVWVARWGHCGERLMGISPFVTSQEDQ